jgi:hypothetical protein
MESDAIPEVNEADAQEQAEPLEEPVSTPDPPDRGLEVPEADAIEQSQPSPLTDDDDYDR